jgi:hypothetical protein
VIALLGVGRAAYRVIRPLVASGTKKMSRSGKRIPVAYSRRNTMLLHNTRAHSTFEITPPELDIGVSPGLRARPAPGSARQQTERSTVSNKAGAGRPGEHWGRNASTAEGRSNSRRTALARCKTNRICGYEVAPYSGGVNPYSANLETTRRRLP